MFYLSLETGLGFDWMCNYDICVRVYTLLADSISMFMGAFFFVTNFCAFSLDGILIVQGAFFSVLCIFIVSHPSTLRLVCYAFLWF